MKKPQSSTRFTFIFRHAWCEFWRCFKGLRNGSSAPGGRDFLWLTLAATLLLGVGLMLAVIYQGLIDKFADSLLGHIEGHGVPVWVQGTVSDVFNTRLYQCFKNQDYVQNKDKSTCKNQDQVQNGDEPTISASAASLKLLSEVNFFPYRTVDGEIGSRFRLPNIAKTWDSDGDKRRFTGWAITSQDPLWAWALAQNGLDIKSEKTDQDHQKAPLQIILNASAFNGFDYSAYLDYLKNKIPRPMFEDLPQSLEKDNPKVLQNLWLKVGHKEELTPFKVIWVDSFPTLKNIAFLLPISTFHVVDAIRHDENLKYYMESVNGKEVDRIEKIRLYNKDENTELEKLLNIINCLPENKIEKEPDEYDLIINFKPPIPKAWISACAGEEFLSEYSNLNRLIEITPSLSNQIRIFQYSIENKIENKTYNYEKARFNGANIYVRERDRLIKTREALTELIYKDNRILVLGSLYENSLRRFGFLTNILKSIKIPIIIGWILFVIFLIYFSLKSVVDHRHNHYGILMANGVKRYWLGWVLFFQICMALLLGFFIACIIIEITVFAINCLFLKTDAASIGRYSLGLGQIQLLPYLWQTWSWAILVFIATFLLSVLTYFRWVFLPLFPRRALPTDLLE